MSALPEWLWPMEDEEAVQEAERLIEETHNTLRRMEAGLKDQTISGQHLSEQAEKLKSEVNKKMHALEKELMSISEPTSVNPQSHKEGVAKEQRKLKPASAREDGHCRQHTNLNASTSQSKSNSKLNDHSAAQQRAQNISNLHSLSKQWKNVDPKWSSSTAEQVVLTARAKVQDALAVARNVTASLDHHVSASSVHSRPMPKLQARNIGIFEVKSHSDGKIVAPKQRLGQTLLPSISIKQGLEKQSIPSIQILPGEKTALSNVFVCNMKYDDYKERSGDSQDRSAPKVPKKFSVEHQSANTATSKVTDEESAVVQLSRQLAEVEELREVNQAQVNHVLRFLLSRVCNSTPTERATKSPTDSHNKVCDQQDKSHTTSSSDSSQYPIAYDSLSRFLETYKRAADQSMLARKRATVRRKKEVAKHKREIEKAQTFAENHLLIGPLRQGTQVKETDLKQSKLEPQDLMESYSTSSGSNRELELHENAEINANSLREHSTESIPSKEMRDWNSPLQSLKSSSKESVFLPVKSVGGVSAEDYEDDWEEEDNLNKSSNSDEGESLSDSILPPIVEAEELASSVTHSENQKYSIDSPKVEQKSSQFNTTQTTALEKEKAHQEEEKKEIQEEQSVPLFHTMQSSPSNLNGELGTVSVQTQQTEEMLKCGNTHDRPQYLSNSRPMLGERQGEGSETPGAEISQEKPPGTSSGRKMKQHQSTLRRSLVGHHSLCSSSSDAEVNNDSRPPRSSRRQDLSLREDLQLQSAILLNWQLEERLKKTSNETSVAKDQPNLPILHTDVLTDIERRWQRTLDQLDQRLKMIEDNERIHRIANEIKLHSRLECARPIDHGGEKHVSMEEKNSITNTRSNAEMKVPTKDIMVQTSPEKNKFHIEAKEFEPLLTSSMELLSKKPEPINQRFVSSSWQKSLQPSGDLTAELLKYSSMGILPRQGHRERQNSKSSSSSSSSSHFQQSSAMVSLSEGELRNSACGSCSCSCSEGEFCVCGGRKLCSERAPPDGSQTLSDGENFMKDISQGEIPSCKMRHLLQDTSFGEIANHVQVLSGDPYMAEESIESDDIDWELK
ncbi:early endosome antigen 1-like isoform X2 [Thrips palmi]|uniref:Early endosome antigen 1-like isoform X2 n=1 Tax=Thrips palmi TaxID=161013 RepID=A0A6P8Z6M5_THRPL|nr:early endosome antigen 1-like isoform X2 [Thrips palmi]